MARGGERFEKRQRERARQERNAAKRERRQSRGDEVDGPDEGPSTESLMEEFRLLSERHAAGAVASDEFETRRHEIFVALGLETEDDAPDDGD